MIAIAHFMVMSSELSNKDCLAIGIKTLESYGFVEKDGTYLRGNIEWYFDNVARWHWRYVK